MSSPAAQQLLSSRLCKPSTPYLVSNSLSFPSPKSLRNSHRRQLMFTGALQIRCLHCRGNLRLCWMEIGDLVWEIWCCLKRFGNGGLDLVGFGAGVWSLSCSLPELMPSAITNGLDTKVEKSRKQMKERKNRAKKIRGVKKTKAEDAAKAGKKK
ncbi:hypothetical protein Syun_006406 [Stephania yunnanensis]|uniref:Uncharacterized protein n=1 Tax=Stephania yunnanensis TaxID=152371 RepID=A0AAP0KZ62_9MAGN